jgi:Protein of unknown function (DUF3352)
VTITSSPLRAHPRRLAVLAAAALAIPVAGCGSSGDSAAGAGAGDPAKAIPASAPVYLELTVHPTAGQRAGLEAAGRKILHTSDPAAKLQELIDKAGKGSGRTYARDIKPWLGDKAAVAITGFSAGKSQFAVVVDSADDGKAADALARDGDYKAKRSFEGTDYRYDPKDGTAAGVVKHYVVVASEPSFKQIAHLLDKGGASLATSADLQAARDKVGGRPGFAFVDLRGLLGTVAGSASPALGASSALDGILQRFRAFGVGVSADAQAIRLKVASVGGGATGNGPGAALPLQNAPAGAWLALTQRDIGKTISNLLDSLDKAGGGGSVSDALSQLETATGLNVKRDLLSWMGDAGLFVEGDSVPALGGALVVQSTDPAATRTAIAKIRRLLGTLSAQGVGPAPAGTSAGFSVALGSGSARRLLIGLAGSRFVIAVGQKALRDAIHPAATLGSSATFKSASGLLGSTAKPSFYLDFQTLTRFIGLAAHNDAGFAKAKPYLDAFTAVIGGGSGDGTAEVAIGLK